MNNINRETIIKRLKEHKATLNVQICPVSHLAFYIKPPITTITLRILAEHRCLIGSTQDKEGYIRFLIDDGR